MIGCYQNMKNVLLQLKKKYHHWHVVVFPGIIITPRWRYMLLYSTNMSFPETTCIFVISPAPWSFNDKLRPSCKFNFWKINQFFMRHLNFHFKKIFPAQVMPLTFMMSMTSISFLTSDTNYFLVRLAQKPVTIALATH